MKPFLLAVKYLWKPGLFILCFVGILGSLTWNAINYKSYDNQTDSLMPAEKSKQWNDEKEKRDAEAKANDAWFRNEAKQVKPLDQATEKTKIVKFGWSKEGFGSIMIAHFTIRNDSNFAVK